MARVFWRPEGLKARTTGDPLAWAMARHVKVQAALEAVAMSRAAIAEAKLAAHRDTGAARINVDRGDVDWYVMLEDSPDAHGAMNAMAIEVGARGGRGGTHALGTAFPETNVYYL